MPPSEALLPAQAVEAPSPVSTRPSRRWASHAARAVLGIAVALRRHQLFDIERLANRSLVYVTVVAVLAAGYAGLVALLVSGLSLSGTVAAALAAAAAALALAPLRNAAQRAVNQLMYGHRDDPAGVLARLGTRMQAVILPDDVLPAVVETVAQSLRLPYVAIDLADGADSFRVAAEQGTPIGNVHTETLTHHGAAVGRLRVSERGRDEPLEPADLELVRSLAREVGPAVQAVRLHQDLVRSRAEVVALREDERRRAATRSARWAWSGAGSHWSEGGIGRARGATRLDGARVAR